MLKLGQQKCKSKKIISFKISQNKHKINQQSGTISGHIQESSNHMYTSLYNSELNCLSIAY